MLGPLLTGSDLVDLAHLDAEKFGNDGGACGTRPDQHGLLEREFGYSAALAVHGRSDSLEMIGTNTPGLDTEMVDFESLWDWPNLLLVHDAVRKAGLSISPRESVSVVVTVLAVSSDPDPAGRFVAAILDRVVTLSDSSARSTSYPRMSWGEFVARRKSAFTTAALARTFHQAASFVGVARLPQSYRNVTREVS